MTTLKKYISDLQKFADKNPDLLNKQVGYMFDDEGNGFSLNVYTPTMLYFDTASYEHLTVEDMNYYIECGEGGEYKHMKKVVCIN